jgi:hypothetical protein
VSDTRARQDDDPPPPLLGPRVLMSDDPAVVGDSTDPQADLTRIVESAQRLGVELDELEALQWLTAVAAVQQGQEVVVDMGSGVFGHRVSMLDFSPADLAHFRRVGDIVGLRDLPDVETALALSGSAAQSKVQTYPGDCDYFERVNIKAPTREAACLRLAEVMRDQALGHRAGADHRLVEVKFGNYPVDVVRHDRVHRAGTPISWSPQEVEDGLQAARTPEGEPVEVRWEEVALDPGWCKLDWVVADPVRNQVASASNMLDVTWEAPDGSIVPLDGYLDPYFQEVYLEADAVPLFVKLVSNLTSDALDDYVGQLRGEVRKYAVGPSRNLGKAAKRLYNIFRLTGRYEEAVYLRELFDEPSALLYQVGAVVGTLDDASRPGSAITAHTLLSQLDGLIMSVVRTLEGPVESEIMAQLLQLRACITDGPDDDTLAAQAAAASAARAQLADLVNAYFDEKLNAWPPIADYLTAVATEDP